MKKGNQRSMRVVVAIPREGVEEVFNSQLEAAKFLNVDKTAVWAHINDYKGGNRGLHKRGVLIMTYEEYFDLTPKREHHIEPFAKQSGANGRRINQLDRYTHEVLATYRNMSDAARKLGLNSITGISKCCRGEIQHSNGFKWEFAK